MGGTPERDYIEGGAEQDLFVWSDSGDRDKTDGLELDG